MDKLEQNKRIIRNALQFIGVKQHHQIAPNKVVIELTYTWPKRDLNIDINETTPLDYSKKFWIYIKREDQFMTSFDRATNALLSRFSKPRGIENLIKKSKGKTFLTFDTKVSKAGVGIANIINKYIENDNKVICVVNIMLSQIVSAVHSKDEEQVKTVAYALENIARILLQKNTKVFIIAKFKDAVNLIDSVFWSLCKDLEKKLFKDAIILPKGLRTAEAVYWNFKQAKYLYEDQIKDKSKPINLFDTVGSLTIGSWILIYFFNEYLKGNDTGVNIKFVGCGMNTQKKLKRIWENIDLYNELAEEKIKKTSKIEEGFWSWIDKYVTVCDDLYSGRYFKLVDNMIETDTGSVLLNKVYEAKWFANMMIHIEQNKLKEDTNIFRLVWSDDVTI